jgi:LysM repeat protein
MGMLAMSIRDRLQAYRPMILIIGLSLMIASVAPAAEEESQKKVDYEAGFYYTVKKGDTLWDISQRFNDTPWQWPDLWRENDQLPNPHWIYPGERIRLHRKSGQHEYKEQTIPIPEVTPQVEASTPEAAPEPQVQFFYNRMDRVGFIRKPPVEPVGYIDKSLKNKKIISENDQVYIRPPKSQSTSTLTPGQRLTAYRELNPTPARNSRRVIGTQHYLLGVVEIISNESKYAIGKVIKGYREIMPGEPLMNYEAFSPSIDVTQSTPGIEGTILASEEQTNLISDHVISFIDKGRVDNIRPGQIYSVYTQQTMGRIQLKPVEIGTVVVLRTEETTSTVYVTKALDKIEPGEKIRTP